MARHTRLPGKRFSYFHCIRWHNSSAHRIGKLRHLSLRRASTGTLSSYRWDMVSQRQRWDWDNSSQESQDTGPITNISSIGILVTEYAMGVHRPLRNKGNTRSSTMRQHVGETLAVSRLELFHRASTHGDLQAWAAFQQSLEETVLTCSMTIQLAKLRVACRAKGTSSHRPL